MRLGIPLLAAALCRVSAPLSGGPAAELSGAVAGGSFFNVVRKGDSLASLGARYGEAPAVLAHRNGLARDARLQPGQVLAIDDRHIVPVGTDDGLLINVPQRMLFSFEAGSMASSYPVAVGRPGWETPRGNFFVATKETDPVWDVPISIQREMRREGKRVEKRVLPGPKNPLGRRWMGLSPSACGIHGTNAPASIYRFATHGCIRMHPDDVEELFPRIALGTPVTVIYRPILLARLDDGTILLEVNPDPYRRSEPPGRTARALLERHGLTAHCDPARVRDAVQRRDGIATVIGRSSEPQSRKRATVATQTTTSANGTVPRVFGYARCSSGKRSAIEM